MSTRVYTKYYRVADITIEVKSTLPITENTFHPKFRQFEVDGPGIDNVIIRHQFDKNSGIQVDVQDRIYFRPPWAIYQKDDQCVYQWIEVEPPYKNYFRTVVANREHSYLDIFNDESIRKMFLAGSLSSLTMFPTDQILLGRLLAYRNGCIMHSLGIILNGNGYLFIGHSSAGKSTMAQMLIKEAVILCDDRNIIRNMNNELMLSGTWSHGDVPDISALSAPLKAVFFLEKSEGNEIVRINDSAAITKTLLACLIRPLVTREWWVRSIDLVSDISKKIPFSCLKFDKSGNILDLLKHFDAELYRE
jgi:hypothetical protein